MPRSMERKSLLHDMNNSLAVLVFGIGTVSRCVEQGVAAEVVERTLHNMSCSVSAIKDGVMRMYDMEIHASAANAHKPVTVMEKVKGLAETLGPLEERFGVTVTVTHGLSESCAVYTDIALANEVATKLIENAAKAKAKTVHIHYEEQEELVLITFADDGEGMNEATLDALGLLPPITESPSGGKGAYLVKQLIGMAGGTVEWTSRKGIGTWASIRLRKVHPAGTERDYWEEK